MQYALLIYNTSGDATEDVERPMDTRVAAILQRPDIVTWARLRHPSSATTTTKREEGKSLLVDGPFVDSKEYLGGLIIIEAENLDGAIAIADELQDTRSAGGAIEIRPMLG